MSINKLSCLSALVIATLSACKSTPEQNPTPPAAPSVAVMEIRPRDVENKSNDTQGITSPFFSNLDQATLSADQSAKVQALRSDIASARNEAQLVQTKLRNALAEGAAAGSINRAKLDPEIEALTTTTQAAQAKAQTGLKQLHTTLDGTQRKRLAEAIKLNPQEATEPSASPDALLLSPEQKTKIENLLVERARGGDDALRAQLSAARSSREKTVDAFANDSFDPNTSAGKDDSSSTFKAALSQYVGTIEAVLPMLTNEQRALFATRLREQKLDDSTAKFNSGLCCFFKVSCCW